MTYVEMQTTDIAKAQVTEAIARMKKLDIHENAIREFEQSGKLNLSEPACGNLIGVLFWLGEDEQKMVKEWEQKTGNIVYHVIKNHLVDLGLCYTFLYVSAYDDEWQLDREDMDDGTQFAYVKNMTYDDCSEFGTVGIKSAFGGVVRTA